MTAPMSESTAPPPREWSEQLPSLGSHSSPPIQMVEPERRIGIHPQASEAVLHGPSHCGIDMSDRAGVRAAVHRVRERDLRTVVASAGPRNAAGVIERRSVLT